MTRTVTTRDVAEMEGLAAEGLSRREISALTGWSYATVRKHVGHLVRGVGSPVADLDRYRRMLRAREAAGIGELDAIARRFGLKDARVLSVALVNARRFVAAAEGKSR